ncbi:hypothetical protein [Mycobacterium xenopi]|uniref:hypothetical protein n=1 Tax=Mycobacterium xenopi TaxID=1789 RepID=UPI003A5995DA
MPYLIVHASTLSGDFPTEVLNLLDGRVEQIREFLNRLDTFTVELNRQRDDLTHAIDLTNQLLSLNPWMGDFVLPSTRLFWDAAECGAVGRG